MQGDRVAGILARPVMQRPILEEPFMTDPGRPDLPDAPEDIQPGGGPGSVPDSSEPGEDDLVKTSDELDGRDAQHDVSAQEAEQEPAEDAGTVEDDESATATNAGVVGQAGIGNA
jgi:hypothetical protein